MTPETLLVKCFITYTQKSIIYGDHLKDFPLEWFVDKLYSKVARLKDFKTKSFKVEESFFDTASEIVNYAIIAISAIKKITYEEANGSVIKLYKDKNADYNQSWKVFETNSLVYECYNKVLRLKSLLKSEVENTEILILDNLYDLCLYGCFVYCKEFTSPTTPDSFKVGGGTSATITVCEEVGSFPKGLLKHLSTSIEDDFDMTFSLDSTLKILYQTQKQLDNGEYTAVTNALEKSRKSYNDGLNICCEIPLTEPENCVISSFSQDEEENEDIKLLESWLKELGDFLWRGLELASRTGYKGERAEMCGSIHTLRPGQHQLKSETIHIPLELFGAIKEIAKFLYDKSLECGYKSLGVIYSNEGYQTCYIFPSKDEGNKLKEYDSNTDSCLFNQMRNDEDFHSLVKWTKALPIEFLKTVNGGGRRMGFLGVQKIAGQLLQTDLGVQPDAILNAPSEKLAEIIYLKCKEKGYTEVSLYYYPDACWLKKVSSYTFKQKL